MSAFTSASDLDDTGREHTQRDHAGIHHHQEGDPVIVHYHTMGERDLDSEAGTVTEVVETDTRGRTRSAIIVDTEERPLRVTWNACVAVDVPDQTTNPQIGMWATVEPRGDEQ